jgi:di/tricarboxylate transporter
MENHLIITLVILAAALLLFLTNRLSADLVALLVVVALGVTSVLTPQEAFSGFSRQAVITIIAIFVLTEALQRTGVTEQVGNVLQKAGGRSETHLVVTVMIAGAFLSLFMNNIAAAAVLLPAVSGAAKRASVSTSKILMPLAFGTILGGMATLFTTTNILLNSMLKDHGIESYRVTDFLPLGIPLVIAGVIYMALLGRKFLPGDSLADRTQAPNSDGKSDLVTTYGLAGKLFRARVPRDSILIGKSLSECALREDFDVNVVAIERKKKKILDLSPQTKLREGDTLVLEGDEADFRKRDVQPYMEFLPAPRWRESDLESHVIEVVEAMLAPRSRLIGETLRGVHFREKYGMAVLAIWHGDQEIITDLGDVELHFGDALLLQGPREKLAVLEDDPDLILLASDEEREIIVPQKGRAALMIFSATLVFAAILPDLTGMVMLGGALAMVLTQIINIEQAYAAIEWKSVFLVAGMLPMGLALTKTNAAGLAAGSLLGVLGAYGPIAVVCGMLLLTVVLTQAVNGAVAASIIGPVAIQVAQQANINPRSMVIGVAMAASMAFSTPLGHAVNILVMSPGGYSFRDYMKIGVPLTVLLFVVLMIFLPIFWPL